jgi:hypothetical protein
MLEWCLADKEIGALLIAIDFTECISERAMSVRLLHFS